MLYTIAVVLLILWLLGLVSGYTIGADIVIDGGLTLHPLGIYSREQIESSNAPTEE